MRPAGCRCRCSPDRRGWIWTDWNSILRSRMQPAGKLVEVLENDVAWSGLKDVNWGLVLRIGGVGLLARFVVSRRGHSEE